MRWHIRVPNLTFDNLCKFRNPMENLRKNAPLLKAIIIGNLQHKLYPVIIVFIYKKNDHVVYNAIDQNLQHNLAQKIIEDSFNQIETNKLTKKKLKRQRFSARKEGKKR